MFRLLRWAATVLLLMLLAPAVLTELGRLLVPLMVKGLVIALIVGALWCALRIWQARQYGVTARTGSRRGSKP